MLEILWIRLRVRRRHIHKALARSSSIRTTSHWKHLRKSIKDRKKQIVILIQTTVSGKKFGKSAVWLQSKHLLECTQPSSVTAKSEMAQQTQPFALPRWPSCVQGHKPVVLTSTIHVISDSLPNLYHLVVSSCTVSITNETIKPTAITGSTKLKLKPTNENEWIQQLT